MAKYENIASPSNIHISFTVTKIQEIRLNIQTNDHSDRNGQTNMRKCTNNNIRNIFYISLVDCNNNFKSCDVFEYSKCLFVRWYLQQRLDYTRKYKSEITYVSTLNYLLYGKIFEILNSGVL